MTNVVFVRLCNSNKILIAIANCYAGCQYVFAYAILAKFAMLSAYFQLDRSNLGVLTEAGFLSYSCLV